MRYEEYLKLPDIEQAFNDMFEERRDYYRLKSSEFGITADHVELFSIKMAYLSTDIHFTDQYTRIITINNKKTPLLVESEA